MHAQEDGEREEIDGKVSRPCSIDGVIAEFGDLAPGTIIQEVALRRLFNRSKDSICLAVERQELPPPVRLFGQNTWTVGVLVDYLVDRQREAAQAVADEREAAVTKETEIRQIITKHVL